MIALDSFVPFVLPYVMGAGDPALLKAIRDTCIDFCDRTDLVQRVTPQNIVANQEDYVVTAPTLMQLARVLAVFWQGRWLDVVVPDDVQSDVALTGVTIGTVQPLTGNPTKFFLKTPTASSVSAYPIPDTALTNGLTIKASFKPTQAADTVEDVLFNEYATEIGFGAAGRLMITPGQTYTSQAATGFLTAYERGVSKAKLRKLFGQNANNARVRPVPFV